MSIRFERNDQNTVNEVAKQFINFYYQNLNTKNYEQINTLIKPYSIISFEKARYEGKNINPLFQVYNNKNIKFTPKDFDTLHSGARRINILVNGVISYNENGQIFERQFTEYIHLATNKESQFWIQMAIFKLI